MYDNNRHSYFLCIVCSLNCTSGFIPDDDCVECILNDSCIAFIPCENGGICMLGSSPDKFNCDCTNNYDPASNCSGKCNYSQCLCFQVILSFSDCSLNCTAGFIPDDDCVECILNDSCVAFTPCDNGGICMLGSSPDKFDCDCTNNYDPASNCSGKYKSKRISKWAHFPFRL